MSFPAINFSEILSELSDNQEGRLSPRQKRKIRKDIENCESVEKIVKGFENILLDALEFQKATLK
jgi:hypothetical protein